MAARGQTRFFVALRDPKLRDPLSDVVSVIIALNAGARRLRSLLNYRLRSANNVPLSTLAPLVSPPHTLVPRRSSSLVRWRDRAQLRKRLPLSLSFFLSFLPPPSPAPFRPVFSPMHRGVAYLLLASPLNGISVLSDGPRAELRPCASLARFPLRRPLASSPGPSYSGILFAEYIAARERRCALSSPRPRARASDRDYNALRSRYCYQCNGAGHDFSGSKF